MNFNYLNINVKFSEKFTSQYRFGFNGQEKDNEIDGSGNSMSAEYWQYDARLGRRWNVDPVVKPWESPYAAFGNNPIYYKDPKGNDKEGPGNEVELKDGKGHKSSSWEMPGQPSPEAPKVNTITTDSKTCKIEGGVTFGTPAAKSFYDNSISMYKYKERGIIGRMITGQKSKRVRNENFQFAMLSIANQTRGADLTFTTGNENYLSKTGENSYTIFWNPASDFQAGTSAAFEEFFHFSNAYNGVANYSLKNGNWGIWDNSDLLIEEARAKFMVITQIANIKIYNIEMSEEWGDNIYGYMYTNFGYMKAKGMTADKIKEFISSSGPLEMQPITLRKYTDPHYQQTIRNFYSIPAQGTYQHLK